MVDFIKILDTIDSRKWFRVKFVKRTDGSIREMTCRTGVQQGVKGKGQSYDVTSKGLITVWIPESDRRSKTDTGFRNLPVDSIIEVHAEGKVWR